MARSRTVESKEKNGEFDLTSRTMWLSSMVFICRSMRNDIEWNWNLRTSKSQVGRPALLDLT